MTGPIDGHSVLASASANGNIAFWDLNENGRLLHIARGAHDRSITAIAWVPGQPLLISSGEDNSVKVRVTYHLDDSFVVNHLLAMAL